MSAEIVAAAVASATAAVNRRVDGVSGWDVLYILTGLGSAVPAAPPPPAEQAWQSWRPNPLSANSCGEHGTFLAPPSRSAASILQLSRYVLLSLAVLWSWTRGAAGGEVGFMRG